MKISLTHDHSLFVEQRTRCSKCESRPHGSVIIITELLYSTGKDELLETAMKLHDVAMNDEYFIKRKLAPNVDFW